MEMEQETEARSAVQTLGFDSKVRTEICRIFQCTKMIWDELQDAPAGFLERADDINANSLRETILGSSAALRGSSEKISNLLNDYYSSRSNTSRLSRHRDPSGDSAGSPHNPSLTESGVTNTSRLSRHRDPSGDPAGSPHNSFLTESGVTDGLPPNPVWLWLASDSDEEAASSPVSPPVRFNQAAPNEGDGSADHDLSEQSVSKQRAKQRTCERGYSIRQRGTSTLLGSVGLPEDGFTWWKYGQKAVAGSKFPRSYYKCTYRKNEKSCPARKHAHQSDEDPSIFGITYWGNHTCPPTTFKRQSTKEGRDIPSTSSVVDNESWPRASIMTEELQLREDVQCLGFSTWDDVFDLSRTLVLGDVTSSDDQLQFAFFHMEAMIRLFGCGLPYSQVSILLERQEIWIEEMAQESWKGLWMNSYEGALRPFLFDSTKYEMEGNPEGLKTEAEKGVFHLNKRQALSEFGISSDGPQLQGFVKLSGITRAGLEADISWEPSWINWIKGMVDHVFPNGMAPHGLKKKIDGLSGQPLQRHARPIVKGEKSCVNQSAMEANLSVAHEGADSGQQKRSLLVIVTFNGLTYPFFKYSTDRESAEEITADDSNLPQRISYIQPQLTVEFVRGSEEEKYVNTTLEVKYQMASCQDEWPSGWFQNNLRLSFRSSDEDGSQAVTDTGVNGIRSTETDTTSQYGGSRSDQHGGSREGGGQGTLFNTLSINGKVSGQHGSTMQTTWNDQSKFTSSRDTLISHPFFGIHNHSIQSKVEYEASFWPVQDPSTFYCMQPWHRLEHSGLRSGVPIEAEAWWELYGKGMHEYIFEGSKKLTKCTKLERDEDGAQHSKRIKLMSGQSSTSSSNQTIIENDVTQDVVLQIFRKKFFINHDFTQFMSRYKKPSAYRWRVLEKASPVPRALNE